MKLLLQMPSCREALRNPTRISTVFRQKLRAMHRWIRVTHQPRELLVAILLATASAAIAALPLEQRVQPSEWRHEQR